MRRGGYGIYGRELDVFNRYEAFRDDPRVQERLQEAGIVQEGTGAPEGRADFPIFLQTIIRYRMRERFRTVASKWDQYLGVENAQDFREHRITQLNGIVGMEPVNEYGEYKRLRSAEERGPSYSVGKHGGIYEITFEMIMNDEADRMLNRIPRELGRMSAEYVSRIAVALMESNPNYIDGAPFFSTSRGNERTGATALPTEDNLISILDQMTLRRDANGIPFTVDPTKVITRTRETAFLIRKIIRSQQTVNVTADPGATSFGRGNLALGAVDDGVLPGDAPIQEQWMNDPDDWIVLANADDRPAFVIAFLRNQREPFIGLMDEGVRSAMGGGRDPYRFNIDTIPFKVRHVFGTAVAEPMAAYRARPT